MEIRINALGASLVCCTDDSHLSDKGLLLFVTGHGFALGFKEVQFWTEGASQPSSIDRGYDSRGKFKELSLDVLAD